MLSAAVLVKVQFYDVDPMQVVWHGNYPRFLEQARCALLDLIGYNYVEMANSGYLWPIVDMRIKYVRPAKFGQTLRIQAELAEYENRLRIDYRIRDADTAETLTKARTVQIAVVAKTGELCFESPAALVDRVRGRL